MWGAGPQCGGQDLGVGVGSRCGGQDLGVGAATRHSCCLLATSPHSPEIKLQANLPSPTPLHSNLKATLCSKDASGISRMDFYVVH